MSSNPPEQQQRKPIIRMRAAGGMTTSPVPFEMGLKGSAYRYGATIVGGQTNLYSDGNLCYAYPGTTAGFITSQNPTLGNGVFNLIQNSPFGYLLPGPFDTGPSRALDVYGEWFSESGLLMKENFTIAGTISQVTNLSTTILGAGTNFTTAVLPGYAYTPSLNLPRVGDIISITQTGTTYLHRITSITSAIDMTIFPAWQGASAGPGAGLVYTIQRSGWNSRSRTVVILNASNAYYYYAGNCLGKRSGNAGAVECAFGGNGAASVHFMSPLAGAAQARANDVAYYKSFMVYGAGTSISWSVAGFPTSFATGFGATDFPAANIAVLDPSDEFVSFEYVGDQLVCIFENSAWLMRPTGSVPEFDFQRLPIDPFTCYEYNANFPAGYTSQVNTAPLQTRPTASGRGACFIQSDSGLLQIGAGGSTRVSKVVQAYSGWIPSGNSRDQRAYTVAHEPCEGIVTVQEITRQEMAAYNTETQEWSRVLLEGGTDTCRLFYPGTGRMAGLADYYVRQNTWVYWRLSDHSTRQFAVFPPETTDYQPPSTTANAQPWIWPSPIAYVSDIYPDYRFGGFAIRARARTDATNQSELLTWAIYTGLSPYAMTQRLTGTANYFAGTPNTIDLLGQVYDDPYIAIVLSGSQWIELDGVDIYPSDYGAGR